MVLFGLVLLKAGVHDNLPWLHGLKIVAVAVVAQALWGMSIALCPDKTRASLAILACIGASLIPGVIGQILVILLGGIFGLFFLSSTKALPTNELTFQLSKSTGVCVLLFFFILLTLLPILSLYTGSYPVQLFDAFYRVGALVFGGGHVVLPLLQAKVVTTGWVDNSLFLAGYGAAQALPGPLFTFAGFLGAVSTNTPNEWLGAIIALFAIFLPSFLLIIGVLPLWENLRQYPSMQRVILGVNASVVGLLLAAFYNPVWSNAIFSLNDYLLAVAAFLLLQFWRVQAWMVVIFCAFVTGLVNW